jgi:hypothetical protein
MVEVLNHAILTPLILIATSVATCYYYYTVGVQNLKKSAERFQS